MEKEEILAKAQEENKGVDLVDKQAQKEGAWIAYFVAVLAIIVVDMVNGFVLNNVNRGADFALFSMAFTAFLVKYIKLRKRHELFVAICWDKFIKFKNEVICRYVPMQFQFNRVSFARDIVFRFDESTQQINSLAFRLSDVSERDLIKATKSSMNSTLVIMTFLEDYQTSYGLRRIEYLEQVLSDNALIIVGHVVDKAEVADQRTLNLDAKQVSFIRRTKAEYIANLRDKFARLDYINIHFANLEVERSSSDEETYGIQVKQYYYASNYSDEGYLFLMVDLTGDTPIIHVRAWQDVKTDIRDLVTLRDVF